MDYNKIYNFSLYVIFKYYKPNDLILAKIFKMKILA